MNRFSVFYTVLQFYFHLASIYVQLLIKNYLIVSAGPQSPVLCLSTPAINQEKTACKSAAIEEYYWAEVQQSVLPWPVLHSNMNSTQL